MTYALSPLSEQTRSLRFSFRNSTDAPYSLPGPGEANGFRSMSLRSRMVIKVDAGIEAYALSFWYLSSLTLA